MSGRHQPANGADSPAALVELDLADRAAFCPVCGRGSSRVAGPVRAAFRRIAEHMLRDHDVAIAPLFRAELDGALRRAVRAVEAPADDAGPVDPFYPTGAGW